jgi:hypothetical protein
MKLAIMQPYVFPYIGYFQLIHAVDKFVFLDDVAFIKRGWINRNTILVNGSGHVFTIPCEGVSQNRLINETRFAVDQKAAKKLASTIETSYGKAKYFDVVYPLISNVFNAGCEYADQLARKSIEDICRYLSLSPELKSSVVYSNTHLKGADRLVDICKREGSGHYINPIGGVELYSREHFRAHGIDLNFLKPAIVPYQQYSFTFVPSLSIIDVLMFNSAETIRERLFQYDLV